MNKVILVTGASSGIGRVTARMLAERGYNVYGTSRHPKAETLDGFKLIALDVSDPNSVTACVEHVLAEAGQIDVLINNAGIELLGAIEEISIDEARRLFDVNFFGLAHMTQTVLPHMRAHKRGTIINISSTAGLTSGAFQGYYAATKHAVEAYTEALWWELEPFNIRVALVEPGIFKSDIANKRIRPANSLEDYDEKRRKIIGTFEGYIDRGSDPAPVGKAILQIVEGKRRGLRHIVASLDMRLTILSKVSPAWLVRLYGGIWQGFIHVPFLPRNRHQ